jgi:hypothetical protein
MNSARPQKLHSAKWEEKIQNGAVKYVYVRVCTPTSAEGHNLNNEDNVVDIVTFYYKNNSVIAIIKC